MNFPVKKGCRPEIWEVGSHESTGQHHRHHRHRSRAGSDPGRHFPHWLMAERMQTTSWG